VIAVSPLTASSLMANYAFLNSVPLGSSMDLDIELMSKEIRWAVSLSLENKDYTLKVV
jgi:hypothetical protein